MDNVKTLENCLSTKSMWDVGTHHSSNSPFFKGGEVNFNYLPRRKN